MGTTRTVGLLFVSSVETRQLSSPGGHVERTDWINLKIFLMSCLFVSDFGLYNAHVRFSSPCAKPTVGAQDHGITEHHPPSDRRGRVKPCQKN